jgi:hypothetical protein
MAWSIFTNGGGDSVAVAWAKQFLQTIGAPVTPGNTEFVYQWEKSEGGGGAYNPLNQGPVPGQPQLTTTGSQYGGGAADYASWQAGLTGAAAYLNMPYYTQVLSDLKANDPAGARTALWQSPWAASHYGYGTNWSNVPLPGNASTVTPLNPSTQPTSGSGSPTAQTTAASGSDTCMLGFTLGATAGTAPLGGILGWLAPGNLGNGVPASPGSTICFFSKTNARAFLGAMILTAGGLVGLYGVVTLMKYGVEKANVPQTLQRLPYASRL